MFRQGFLTKNENNFYKNKVNSLIAKSKVKYFKQLFERNRNDIRSTWKLINTITNKTSNSHSIKSILWNEKLFTNDIDIAEIFNNYFANIATELDECLPTNNVDPLSYVSRHVNSSMFFNFTDPNECSAIIRNLKIINQNKDAVPVKLLISNCDFLSITISDMINCSISQSVFPDLLKFAIITPIFKKGDRQIPSNYRPISVLPIY